MSKLTTQRCNPKKTAIEPTWLASDENTITRLFAVKKQSRLKKHKILNGFVLVRRKEDNEFTAFLTVLKQNIERFPSNTRMSLVIRTLFYDPRLDKPDLWDSTKKSPKHWTAVDLLVDSKKKLHSFVLDAANSVGYQGIHHELKELFPDGKHYIFEEDKIISPSDKLKTRVIQTQYRGCHIFALQHASILSNIDTDTLYHNELPALAAKNPSKSGLIQPGDFTEPMAIAKIFVPTQSLSTIESLSIKDTSVMQKGETRTLLEAIQLKTTTISSAEGLLRLNQTSYQKNLRYIEKESIFYQFSRNKKCRIMNSRKGHLFLQNRGLINLTAALKQLNSLEDSRQFIEKIHDFFMDELPTLPKKIRPYIDELKLLAYSDQYTLEEINYELILALENLFTHIKSYAHYDAVRVKCNRIIECTLFIYFSSCQVGIINSNQAYLFSKNPCLPQLIEATKSVETIEDIRSIIVHLQEKMRIFSFKKHELWDGDIEQLIALCDPLRLSLAAINKQLIFLVKTLFFYFDMKNDDVNREIFAGIIEETLVLYFETSVENEDDHFIALP